MYVNFFFSSSRPPTDDRSEINPRFISFLKGTLGKMVETNILNETFINSDMWASWPRKFYNIRVYDMTKDQFGVSQQQQQQQQHEMPREEDQPQEDHQPPMEDHQPPMEDQEQENVLSQSILKANINTLGKCPEF